MIQWIHEHVQWIAGLFISLLVWVAGTATYITKIRQRSKSNSMRIDGISANINQMKKDINDIENCQIRADEKITMILENQKEMIKLMKQ